MAAAETAKLIAELSLDVRKFTGGADKAMSKLSKLGAKSTAIGTAVGVGLERLAEAGIRKLAGAVTGGLNSLAELEDAETSVAGAISQVGKGWTLTASQISEKANQIEAATQAAFDDKEITQSATTLIRYGKISQANLFPAMEVMTDLAARTGSVASASEALARALADPTKATRLLRTAGVTLSKDQQKQIKLWVENGQLAKAQAFLLGEVGKQTKGAAAAMHGPFRDSQLVLADVVEDAQRALGMGLLPVLMEVRDELSTELAKKSTLDNIRKLGTGLADGFREAVKWVKAVPWDQVGDVAKGLLDFGKGIASAFMGLPTEAKSLILGLAAINKLSGGGVIKIGVDLLSGVGGTLFSQFLGRGSPANPMFVVAENGGLGGGLGAAAGGGLLGGALKLILPIGIGLAIGEALGPILAPVLGPLLRDLPTRDTRDTTSGTSIAARTIAGRTGGLSPDERQEINDTQARLDKIEGTGISTVTRLSENKAAVERVRSSAESNRIAVVTGGHSDADRIIAALHAMKLALSLNIRTGNTSVAYQSALFLNRASRLESKGIY